MDMGGFRNCTNIRKPSLIYGFNIKKKLTDVNRRVKNDVDLLVITHQQTLDGSKRVFGCHELLVYASLLTTCSYQFASYLSRQLHFFQTKSLVNISLGLIMFLCILKVYA